MKRASAAGLILLLVATGIAAAAEGDDEGPDRIKLGEFVAASEPFPTPAISLVDLSGNTVDLSDFRGKLTLVNLWATWCEPCLGVIEPLLAGGGAVKASSD